MQSHRRISLIIGTVSLALLTLTSCSMKKYCPAPSIELPQTLYKEQVEEVKIDSMAMADIEWWEIYTDTILQRLIRKTLDNNRNMQSAIAKIRELRYTSRATLAENLPAIDARAYGENEVDHYYGTVREDDYEIGLKAIFSWEYNLFGAQAWNSIKARNSYLASIEGQRALQMSLIAQVAKSYFELISLDQQLDIVKRTIETRRESMEKAEIRFKGGLTSETTYRQTIVEYASAATLVPDLEKQIALKENEISLLAGEFPSVVERSSQSLRSNAMPAISLGLPSELLLRRPDIRQARAKLDAAMADAGFSFASRFPSLSLRLGLGFENNSFQHYFQSPYFYPVASLISPIFAFGKNQAKYKASIERYYQEKAAYEQSVLTAFKEVNDAMVTYQKFTESSNLTRNLREAASKYVELAELQYLNGVISYMDVLDAQRTYFSAQLSLVKSYYAEHLALIDLYKALGGGWNEELPEKALTQAQKRKQDKAVKRGMQDSIRLRPGLDKEETLKVMYREFLGGQVTESTENLIHQDLQPADESKTDRKNRTEGNGKRKRRDRR